MFSQPTQLVYFVCVSSIDITMMVRRQGRDHKDIMSFGKVHHNLYVSENKWTRFINFWICSDLTNATNLVCAHVCADLTADEQDLVFPTFQFTKVC